MHDTEYRCATALAAALGRDIQAVLEADEVRSLEGVAMWHDGDRDVWIRASVTGQIEITFNNWGTILVWRPDHRPHYWLLHAAMAAVEEARDLIGGADGVSNETPS